MLFLKTYNKLEEREDEKGKATTIVEKEKQLRYSNSQCVGWMRSPFNFLL